MIAPPATRLAEGGGLAVYGEDVGEGLRSASELHRHPFVVFGVRESDVSCGDDERGRGRFFSTVQVAEGIHRFEILTFGHLILEVVYETHQSLQVWIHGGG
jgi:hypothetical protein